MVKGVMEARPILQGFAFRAAVLAVLFGKVLFAMSAQGAEDSALVPQDAPGMGITFSGHLDAGLAVLSPEEGSTGGTAAWTGLGTLSGWLGMSGGTKAVKAELRLGLESWPSPAVNLSRALVRFRFPGLRAALGLGRMEWGPGFVFVAGDLVHDSAGLGVNLTQDELRSVSSWLADVSVTLADEAFVEAEYLVPDLSVPDTGAEIYVPMPGKLEDSAGALRFSADLGGVLVELAWALDGGHDLNKCAFSTQFNAGLDWYATLRLDLPFEGPAWDQALWNGFSGTAGAFGMWDLGEGFGLSTRHEVLVLPGGTWVQDASASFRPEGWAGAGLAYGLYIYDELSLSLPESLALSLRVMISPLDQSAVFVPQLAWSPLQGLSLYLRGAIQAGADPDDAFFRGSQGGTSLGLGAVVRF